MVNLFDRQVKRYADTVLLMKSSTSPAVQAECGRRLESITTIIEQAGIELAPFLTAVDRRVAEAS